MPESRPDAGPLALTLHLAQTLASSFALGIHQGSPKPRLFSHLSLEHLMVELQLSTLLVG